MMILKMFMLKIDSHITNKNHNYDDLRLIEISQRVVASVANDHLSATLINLSNS